MKEFKGKFIIWFTTIYNPVILSKAIDSLELVKNELCEIPLLRGGSEADEVDSVNANLNSNFSTSKNFYFKG
jgi:hypothetical protein